MITPDFKKKMADSWFSYLQIQICKEFEYLEKNKVKFSKRDWNKNKKNEGGGTSFLLSNGKIFDKVGVNKSTVSGIFPQQFRSKILGAEKKGKYWASGVSVVAHMRNPKIPAIHFNTRFIVTSKEWFGGGMDVTPSYKDLKEKKMIHDELKKVCVQNKKNYKKYKKSRIVLMTTKAKKLYHKFKFKKNDMLLFGKESAGVPEEIHRMLKNKIKIPMNKKTRSLNVAMSVAIVASEALRQNNLLK